MLGGDNMDAAIARKAEEQMTVGRAQTHFHPMERTRAGEPRRQGIAAVAGAPENYHLSVVAEGGRLIGGSMSAKLSREDIERIVLDGFFPRCGPDDCRVAPRASRFRSSDYPTRRILRSRDNSPGFLHAHAGGRPTRTRFS